MSLIDQLAGSSCLRATNPPRLWAHRTVVRPGQNDARLRETLRVYLACGASYKVAAEELNMHFNSVKYRVGRAVERRGREIGSDRLEVELALLACHWYGPAVLQP